MTEPWLLIETSGRGGSVGLAVGGAVRGRALDPARRHNRDLAPAVESLLREADLAPPDVLAVAVSVGPGSYTGLRVGVVSAKAWAFATGCRLVPVPTFHALAAQADAAGTLDVVSDGLQGLVYAQRFTAAGGEWHPANDLHLAPAADWAATLPPGGRVTGPAVGLVEALLPPHTTLLPPADRTPTLAGLLHAARRTPDAGPDAVFTLEPLYLRPSSAEEQATKRAMTNAE